MLRKTGAFIAMTRVTNVLLASFGTTLGIYISGGNVRAFESIEIVICAILAVAFGNVMNDIVDIEGDKINHPSRPLAEGVINKKEAVIFSITIFALALLLSFHISFKYFLLTTIPILLLFMYALFLKSTPLIGNLLVSLLVAYTLIFGAISGQNTTRLILPAIMAFLLNFMREIVKDIADSDGDIKTGVKTTASLPLLVVKVILYALCGLYFVLLPFPYLLGNFNAVYIVITLLFVFPLHIYLVILIGKMALKHKTNKISKILKLEMVLGLASILIAEFSKVSPK